jgi:hypothetical protein
VRREARTAAAEGVFRLLAEQAADKPPIPDVSLEYSMLSPETSFLSCLTVIPKGRRCWRFSKLCVSFQDQCNSPLCHLSNNALILSKSWGDFQVLVSPGHRFASMGSPDVSNRNPAVFA